MRSSLLTLIAMLLTYSPNELASFERSGLRSIGFVTPRASGRAGDMPAASLVGLFSIRRLPVAWVSDPKAALAWVELARSFDPEAFESERVGVRDSLAEPVHERDGPERFVFQFPALLDRDLDERDIQLALDHEIERADAQIRELTQRRFLEMSEPRRLAWATYHDTSLRAERALMDSARRIIAALNQASPIPVCLPEPCESPFGWIAPLPLEAAFEALELGHELERPAAQAPPRSL